MRTRLSSGFLAAGLFLVGLFTGPLAAQSDPTRIHEFAGFESTTQNAFLIDGPGELLYGWIGHAGQSRRSVVWRMNRDGTGFTVLHTFGELNGDGEDPTGLILGSDQMLYGTAGDQQGQGRVFSLAIDGSNYRVIKQFSVATDQTVLPFGLMEASNGRLYGITGTGSPLGAIYGINKDGSAFQILARFQRPTTNGQYPRGRLFEGPDGWLYGVTASDRTRFLGTVYRVKPDGTGFETIHNFEGSGQGSLPDSGLVGLADGFLYGQAAGGGVNNLGGVFKLRPTGEDYQFFPTGTGGAQWYRSVTQGADGVLYGLQPGGGPTFNGTFFQLRPDGSDYETLYQFSETAIPPTGVRPKQLVRGRDGHLYCLAFQRSPIPIQSLTAFTPILLRFQHGAAVEPSLVASLDSTGPTPALRVAVTGEPGRTYELQSAGAFPASWQRIKDVTTDDQGRGEFTEAIPASDPSRLFRVTAP